MDRLQGIEAFVRVAQTKSYAEAARLLGVSKSVVSTRIQQLEVSIGTPLLVRNTRSVSLSQAGQAFYQECAQVVGRATELVDQMRDLSSAPSGVLKVHALPAPTVREAEARSVYTAAMFGLGEDRYGRHRHF